MIQRFYLPLILLFLLVFQGMAMSLLPGSLAYSDYLITPHWVLVILILITIFFDHDDTYYSLLYALTFGILIDMVYTSILGVYMFSYGIVIYLLHGLKKMLHGNFIVAVLLAALGIVLTELMLFTIYSFVQVTDIPWESFLSIRLVPTIIANMIFFLLVYPLLKGRLEKWAANILSS
ncbi:rod shape-determining protein MreD [Thalassobacillus devorans]|uniref:Rod shape-determining protein MreD n=1 Tax=Thalassobacillus devorans TaxID=279813 RepID=A0ABQ1PAL6_9BACI|nr:rod shape-determining protein MreD [Thalassobacillus devorans]NIK29798.1 rod shape-determining protein MreD [Thalassobacillus devorans]GGC92888.1 rod shape-determining protein MreD [Thalassobacillus devorans]